MRFNFIGTVDYNAMDSKMPFYREISGKAKGASLSLTSIEAKNNRAFVEVAGFKNDPIKTMDTDGNKIDIAWDDRLDEDSIKKVASYRKHVVTLGDERKEFISEMDFINYVRDHIDEIKGKRYQITGQTRTSEYKGKLTERFQIQSMYEITDAAKKNELKLTGDFYFEKGSIDAADFANDRKVYINGWVKEWIDKDHPNAFVSKQIVLDCNKLDLETERHVAILNYKLRQIGCTYDDGKVLSKLKKNKYYVIPVICKYVNGTETVEFSEKDLTQNQADAISLGLASLDDFRPKGAIFGDRVKIYKLVSYDLRGEYSDGCLETSDFEEDQIYTPSENESLDEAFKDDAMNPPEENDDDEDSLFD